MKGKFLFGLLLVILGVVGITLVLANENALVFHPKGIIAQSILHLILLNFILMWLIIVPTYIFLFAVVYKYCIKGEKGPDQEASSHPWGELILWILPAIIVLVMSFVLWDKTHELNPYKPIESDVKPLIVQVVALDWKWLFIYPELGIATLNYLAYSRTDSDSFKADGRWLADELVLDSATERTNLFHDRNDNTASPDG